MQTEALHRAIIEQTTEALVFADRDGLIRLWNTAAERLYGFSAEEALGRSLDLIIPERFREAHWRGYHTAMSAGVTRRHGAAVPTQARRKDGELIYIEISFNLIRMDDGKVSGAVSVARDITERFLKERSDRKSRRQHAADAGGTK